MLDQSQRRHLENRARALQIVVGAMILGVVTFAVVAWVISRDKAHFEFSLLAIVGVVFAASSLPMAIILPNIIRQNLNQPTAGSGTPTDAPDRVDAIFAGFQSSTIIRFALLEGAAFLNVIAFMIDGASICLIVAGLLLVIMAAMFPRADQITQAIEEDLR